MFFATDVYCVFLPLSKEVPFISNDHPDQSVQYKEKRLICFLFTG